MNRRRAWLACGAVAAALAVAWTGNWFAHRLIPVTYPGALAYKPDDVPPPVDLASIQRVWPGGLSEPAERSRLMAYMKDIEHQAPPPAAAPAAAPVPAKPVDLGALLASADTNAGKEKARACVTCHDFQPGGPDRIGPNLWGVVGRKLASKPGFAYSPAMAGHQGAWTYDRLFAFLAAPARDIPGTKMSYAGLRRPEDRAAIIKYLATLGNSPPPPPRPSGASRSGTAMR